MPLYGVAQAGSNTGGAGKNLTALNTGDSMILFDGTETPATGIKSVAFNRADKGSTDAGVTFAVVFASDPTGTVIKVQAAATDADANYTALTTITATGLTGYSYTATDRSNFYRVTISTYVQGGMPVVTAQR